MKKISYILLIISYFLLGFILIYFNLINPSYEGSWGLILSIIVITIWLVAGFIILTNKNPVIKKDKVEDCLRLIALAPVIVIVIIPIAIFTIDFKNDNIEFYGYQGITYGAKTNTFGFSYSPGVILNYENPGDYDGPFKNYGGGWFWGIDHCYDPRTNHSDAVQGYSIIFGNNKGVYFGEDEYYYWEKREFQNG